MWTIRHIKGSETSHIGRLVENFTTMWVFITRICDLASFIPGVLVSWVPLVVLLQSMTINSLLNKEQKAN